MKNVIAVSGSEGFLRNRAIREVITTQTKKQWNVLEVDAAEPGGVSTAFNHASLCGGRTLAIVKNPEKDLPTIEQHRKTEDDLVVLLLDCVGDVKESTKLGKFLASGVEHHKFSMPAKIWEQESFAESFCLSEAKSYNLKMDKVLARALVEYIGTDIGVLSFEMLKIATLAEADGVQEITKDIVRACLGTVSEGGLQQILEALATRDARRLSKALYRFSHMQKDPKDGVMLVCRAIESKAYSWLPIIKARENGRTPQQAAEESGINAWFYMNKLHPQTVKWTTADTLHLVHEMARSERTLLQGASAPWVSLVTRLLTFCDKKPVAPAQANQKRIEVVCGRTYEKLYEGSLSRTSVSKVAPPFDKPLFLTTPYVFQSEDLWNRCQKFAEDEGRSSVWKNRSQEEGVSDSGIGSAEGKYGEFAIAHYLHERFDFPLALPDLRTERTHPGYAKIRSYDADLDYRVVNPEYPAIQVKTAIHFPGAWTIQSGNQSDRLLKGLVETKVPLKVVLGEGWEKEIYYTAFTGKTIQQDVIALCHVDQAAKCIMIDGFVPWGFLVSEKLIQLPIKNARKGGKMGIYLTSMKYRAGIGDAFVVPEVGGDSPLKVVK